LDRSLVLALDIGTSSVRSALYDCEGNVLAKTMVKNERTLVATDDGGAEIDADEAFRQIVQVIDDVLKRSERIKGNIACVAASSFWHSMVGVDARGKPTTKVFGWADTRSRDQISVLRKRFDEAEIHNRTGARFHSSFWPAKLLWLRKESPRVFERTDKWLSLSDYVALRLCGKPVTSVSMASATGIFDIRKCAWEPSLLRFLKIKIGNLPEVSVNDAVAFQLSSSFAKRWRRLKDARWFPAIGDGAANNIGAGCVQRSRAALMSGTSGAMRVAFRGRPPGKIPSGLWCYRIDRQRMILGGALSDGGGLYRWLKDNLSLGASDNKLEAEIAGRTPDGHGLTFMPFVAGERSTGYHENARGAILGLRTATDPVDIVQAALESVAYRFAEIFDQLNTVAKIEEIIASGGALRESPVWTQMIADTLGQELSLPDVREASSRGAVLLALETIGRIKNVEKIETPKGQTFEARDEIHKTYRLARKRHDEYYKLIISKPPPT
jgi:gluconokinase